MRVNAYVSSLLRDCEMGHAWIYLSVVSCLCLTKVQALTVTVCQSISVDFEEFKGRSIKYSATN